MLGAKNFMISTQQNLTEVDKGYLRFALKAIWIDLLLIHEVNMCANFISLRVASVRR